MEKPLAALRDDLRRLGLSRMTGVSETEDHLGALCEVMRVLIVGCGQGRQHTLADQKQFFYTHLRTWYSRCLGDIRNAENAYFYRQVANFAEAFFELEHQAFEIEEMPEPE